jgi:hypothetical protein
MDVPRFSIMFLDEARDFLKSLDMETKQKIAADLKAATLTVDSTLFKKLHGTEIWNFVLKSMVYSIGCLPFGIKIANHL